jgi:hypothetical protein
VVWFRGEQSTTTVDRVGTLVSQEQVSKDLLESTRKQLFECLVWICTPALLYEVVDSKFQVPSSASTDSATHINASN